MAAFALSAAAAVVGLRSLDVSPPTAGVVGCLLAVGMTALGSRVASAFEKAREAAESAKDAQNKLIDALGDVVYHHDVTTGVLGYVGDTEVLCGRTISEMGTTQDEWIEMIHPADRDRVLACFAQAKAKRSNWGAEYRIRSSRGALYRWVLDRGALTFDAEGELTSVDGVCTGIEDRKRSEERFRSIFDDSRDPHFIVDSRLVLECNDAAVRMLGVADKMDLIGSDFRRFWPERQPDGRRTGEVAEQSAEAARSGRASRVILTKLNARGETFIVEVSTSMMARGGESEAMLVVWRDLREVEAARSKLSSSEARHRHLVESLHQIVYQTDSDGNWTYLNEAWERVTGFEVSTSLGENFSHFVAADDLPKLQEVRARELAGESETSRFEMRLRSHNGRFRTVEGSCRALLDEAGQIVGTTGILTDETERLRVQRDLEAAKEAAESANRAKGEFLAVMSHEIRTPLNGVLGFASLLRQTQLSETQDEYLRTISSCGDSLLTLIDDILDFSRLESGHFEIERRPLQLRECVEDVLDVHAHRANDKGIDVVGSLASDLPAEILGDVTRLRQVLSNLIGNAVKFTDEGHVVVKGGLRERDGAKVTLAFRVEDTGPGIPPEQAGKLFRPFVQADASMSRRYGGTGLGLAICRRLVEAMGGKIAILRSSDGGTVIEFSIVAVESSPAPPQPRWPGRRVLVIDRCEVSRNELVEKLTQAEVVAVGCPTTRSALSWISGSSGIDLVLLSSATDTFEGRDGGLAVAKLAAETGIPVLVALPSNGSGSEIAADLPGERARIAKPVHLAALWRSLERIFSDVAPSDERTPVVQSGSEPESARPLSVLLVEDNPVNRKLMLRMLSLLGYAADHAVDGEACLLRCEERPYDVILMDVQLPGMDGIEATKRLRARKFPGQIVALTAHAMPEDRERCLGAGMNDYLTKPLQMERLRETLVGVEPRGDVVGSDANDPI